MSKNRALDNWKGQVILSQTNTFKRTCPNEKFNNDISIEKFISEKEGIPIDNITKLGWKPHSNDPKDPNSDKVRVYNYQLKEFVKP